MRSITNYIKRGVKYVLHGIPQKTILKCIITQDVPSAKLEGKRILITGGGRGIGEYITEKCVKEGATCLIVGRNEDTLMKISNKLGCEYIVFDISRVEEIPDFFDEAIARMKGEIDCLVNNAGISLHERNMMEVTPESFDKQFDVNLKAPYFLSKAFVKHCQTVGNSNASILFMTSERGLYCDEIPYGLTKAALISLTRGMARRHIKSGIRVNAIAPGITESDMTIVDRNEDMTSTYNCGGRFFLPEEIAEVAVFLLSDISQCISGEVIACDQGNYLRCDW